MWGIGTELWEDGGGNWPVGVLFSDGDVGDDLPAAQARGILLLVNGYGTFIGFPFTVAELFSAVRRQDAKVSEWEFEMATDGLDVVERRDGDAHVGTVHRNKGITTVRTGFAGRPVGLANAEIVAITPARHHPDVELLDECGTVIAR